jgi:2-hydroxy-6-oxonona-2,4-dienedioate hydrolase
MIKAGENEVGAAATLWPQLMAGRFKIHNVMAGGINTRCLEAGEGTDAIVLLHGSGGHLETYTRNILPLAERYRVYAIDMVGHGFTDKPDHGYEIRHYVDHLADFMDAVGLERAPLAGESLGGWAAAQFAVDHPDRVGKLILNTAGGLIANQAVMQRIYDLSMKAVAEASRETVRARLEWLMHDPAVVTDDLVETRLAIYTQPGFARAMEHILCLQIMDIRVPNLLDEDQLRGIAAPTLVVWTSHDPTGAVEVGQKFADLIPDAELVVMDGCGHWPQYEDAPRFNRLVMDFLAR